MGRVERTDHRLSVTVVTVQPELRLRLENLPADWTATCGTDAAIRNADEGRRLRKAAEASPLPGGPATRASV